MQIQLGQKYACERVFTRRTRQCAVGRSLERGDGDRHCEAPSCGGGSIDETLAVLRRIENLTLGGGIDWQGRSSTFVGSPDGGKVLAQGGSARLKLMARYRFSPAWSVQFNADNAPDKKYLVLDQYDNTYYGTPANYTLSLRAAFRGTPVAAKRRRFAALASRPAAQARSARVEPAGSAASGELPP